MTSLTRRSFSLLPLSLLEFASNALAQEPLAPAPAGGVARSGIDIDARDLRVRPGDDFFRYANGRWLTRTRIPPSRARWGTFDILRDDADQAVRAIIEEAVASPSEPGSINQKICDYYSAFMDQDTIDARGLAPIQPELDQIRSLTAVEEVVRFAFTPGIGRIFPIRVYVGIDDGNPERYIAYMTHAGTGLPDRAYYRTSGQFVGIRTAYQAYIERMLTIAGASDPGSTSRDVLALESAIAAYYWPISQRRDSFRTYNLKSRAEIRAMAPNFPWDIAFEAGGFGAIQEAVVSEDTAMPPLANLAMATPVPVWRAYLSFHLLRDCASVLPRAVDDATFEFYGRTLNGYSRQRERWRRGVETMNAALGEAVGRGYVQRHFPPAARAAALSIVDNIRQACISRIDGLSWMSAATKEIAREKVAQCRIKIGHPDRWRDYTQLEVVTGDAVGNLRRQRVFESEHDRARLSRPVDRDEWFLPPQTANAYSNPMFNEITFPAAMLQPPLLQPNADMAASYGAIGTMIAHEMGHAADYSGSHHDENGTLRTWWTKADEDAFAPIAERLRRQYDLYEPVRGAHVNGRQTLGENIGDNGGVQLALLAYTLSRDGREAPVLDGLTGDQRFFLGWAQACCHAVTDDAIRHQVLTDDHSPWVYRCNGTVRNMDTWYAAFDVQSGDGLYLAPADRVTIW